MEHVNRREAILAAASSEFASAGYAGGRIERIAAAAGVNKQLIFHYFQSKDGLYGAAVSAAFADAMRERPAPGSPPDVIKRVIRDVVDLLQDGRLPRTALFDAAVPQGGTAQARAVIREWADSVVTSLLNATADGQRQGFFRDDVWPERVSQLIIAQCVGMAAKPSSRYSLSNIETFLGEWAIEYCSWR